MLSLNVTTSLVLAALSRAGPSLRQGSTAAAALAHSAINAKTNREDRGNMLTITHTHEAGTIIEGTSKGDGSAATLKANGWRWGRSISAWYVPFSRDNLPKHHTITRTAKALENAGFTVELEIDNTSRSTADVEAGKAQRQAERVTALQAKAVRKHELAAAADQRAEAASNALPWGGEPIKIGHHSEQRHRNAIERAHRTLGQSVEADKEAQRADQRAAAAAVTTAARNSPVTVANRIDKLAADVRRLERHINSSVYDEVRGFIPASPEQIAKRAELNGPRLDELRDKLAYWQGVRDEQVAAGIATNYSRDTVKKGDHVKIRGTWSLVQRANPKTVRIQVEAGWDLSYSWAEVKDHRPATK